MSEAPDLSSWLNPATPLGDYLRSEWIKRKIPTWATGSRRHREWTVQILCDSWLADRPIGEIAVYEIERYFAERAGTPFRQRGQLPAHGSLKAIFATLSMAMEDAFRYGVIPVNPCQHVRLPPDRTEPAPIWTREQVNEFLAKTAGSRYHPLWRLLFATGMRRGEALGLSWRSIEFDRKRIVITRALLSDTRRGNEMFGPPKNRRSLRTIHVDPGTLEVMQRWREQREKENGGPLSPDSAVFATARGGIMLPATVSDTFRRQVRELGMPPIPLHSIRHTHLSHLLAAGEPISSVSARAGHSTSAMTLRTYAHTIPGDDERTAERARQLFDEPF